MSEIKPALTPEEWAYHWVCRPMYDSGWPNTESIELCEGGLELSEEHHRIPPGFRHALAALALHGQPYGFTWEDAELVRWAAYYIEGAYGGDDNTVPASDLRHLADRIEALLPPRE